MLDLEDIDAAFAELDARYLAGEAAAHARTWSVIGRSLRRVQPARTSRAGLGQRRPPARYTVRGQQLTATTPRTLGPHARSEHPHRGGTSAERFGAAVTHAETWDLARRLPRRVAGGPTCWQLTAKRINRY